jgi:hypothetical protein
MSVTFLSASIELDIPQTLQFQTPEALISEDQTLAIKTPEHEASISMTSKSQITATESRVRVDKALSN